MPNSSVARKKNPLYRMARFYKINVYVHNIGELLLELLFNFQEKCEQHCHIASLF